MSASPDEDVICLSIDIRDKTVTTESMTTSTLSMNPARWSEVQALSPSDQPLRPLAPKPRNTSPTTPSQLARQLERNSRLIIHGVNSRDPISQLQFTSHDCTTTFHNEYGKTVHMNVAKALAHFRGMQNDGTLFDDFEIWDMLTNVNERMDEVQVWVVLRACKPGFESRVREHVTVHYWRREGETWWLYHKVVDQGRAPDLC